MKQIPRHLSAFLLLVCLLAQTAFSVPVRAYTDMTTGELGIELIKRYESFSPSMYYENGHWYVGYGSQVAKDAYPNGVTEAEAETLLREELTSVESTLNSFFRRNGLSPTQAQFDALVDFTYTMGSSWLNGTSALVKLVRGDTAASRRETARAFGVWCHSGGVVLPGLAQRRLEEAAIYLDGNASKKDEFCYLAVTRESGVEYATDFAVYERGGTYDAFPTMFRLGYTLTGMRASNGVLLRLGDPVTGNRSAMAVWTKNQYVKRSYTDVRSGQWFYDYIMELSEGDIIGGRGDGTYAPDLPATTGEALKLILLAAGNAEQPASGRHWASGYADLARTKGYLPASLLDDLDKPISRLNVAHLAAKAIGYGQSFDDSPFADVDDGFVTALSGVGVLTGMTSHGKSVYYPDASLTRAEVSTIVWCLRNTVALGRTQTVSYGSRTLDVASGVTFNSYNKTGFSGSGLTMTYTEPGVTVLRGIDVSNHQGAIDWQKVKAAGIEFAVLRLGYRGQTVGDVYADKSFEEYYAGAKAAGVRIGGVYLYSQAINIEEALEEADFVLSHIAGKSIDGPVIFDWETAGSDNPGARSNNVPVSVVCDCAVAFCDRVKAAGYTPMVYMNTYDGYIKYDLSRLTDYDVWYAGQYGGAYPRFIYDFVMWQYTDRGDVDGIRGGVDMDLWFIR